MTSLSTLEALLDRVGESEGGDRALDAEIIRALNGGQTTHWFRIAPTTWVTDETCDEITISLDAAIGLVEEALPGWRINCGLCALTGHATIAPDYNGPHRERLLREFPAEQFDSGFHADLAPGDGWHRTCRAILSCLLRALISRARSSEVA